MRMTTTIAAVAAVLVIASAASAQTHAPWPTDWNNWTDPALWCTVGDPGNAADTRVVDDGTTGYGAVAYTYKIGKFEVTAGQYTAFLNAVAATDTYGLYYYNMLYTDVGCGITQSGSSGKYTYTVAPDFANRPANYITWGAAARFCNWLTNGKPTGPQIASTTEDGSYYLNGATTISALQVVKRRANARFVIPTEDEWYKAAYYKGGGTNAGYWNYATRSDRPPGEDMTDVSGNNANYRTWPYVYPIDSGKCTTVVGEFQNSPSCSGTFDQSGNVWEWNEAIPDAGERGLRGGSFSAGGDYNVQAAHRQRLSPMARDEYYGFRVVQVPEPASWFLIATGGLAMLRKRRK